MTNVTWMTPDTEMTGTGLLPAASITESEINEYLAEHDLVINNRYSHQRCPIAPDIQTDKEAPVAVFEEGIFCHVCGKATGNGFRSYSALIGKRSRATGVDISTSARHFTHFQHVEYAFSVVLEGRVSQFAKQIYSAILKRIHASDLLPGDQPITTAMDPRIARVFANIPFVRGESEMLHADTLRPVNHRLSRRTLEMFAFAQKRNDEDSNDKIVTDAARVEMLDQDGRIPGYNPIVPVLGAPVHYYHNQAPIDSDSLHVAPKRGRDCVVYLPFDQRMSRDEIVSTIHAVYPGFDLTYAELVMAAIGCAERGFGEIPMILVIGVSGAAKTAVLMATGAALGEHPFGTTAQKNDNYGEAIGIASQKSSLIFLDEVFKGSAADSGDFGSQGDQLHIDPKLRQILLALSRTYDFRKLHVGTTRIYMNSAIFLADAVIPKSIQDDEQMARRFIYVSLPARVPDWRLSKVDWLDAWKHTPEWRRAFSSLYSNIVDKYFYKGSRLPFIEIAEALGYHLLEQHTTSSEQGSYIKELLVQLFWIILNPGTPELDPSKHKGRGFKSVDVRAADGSATGYIEAIQSLGESPSRCGSIPGLFSNSEMEWALGGDVRGQSCCAM